MSDFGVSERQSDEITFLARAIERDLDAARVKLTQLSSFLAALSVKARPRYECPVCGVASPTQDDLDWHLVNVHDDAAAGQRQGVAYYAERGFGT